MSKWAEKLFAVICEAAFLPWGGNIHLGTDGIKIETWNLLCESQREN